MDEQDHANAKDKLIRAIYDAFQDFTADDAERLVGDLSEFVRGIVREEVRTARCTCPRCDTQPVATDCPVHWRPNRCTCPWSTEAPLSMDCPVHGVPRRQPAPLNVGRGGDPYFRK